ncbi:MAG: phosphatidate cytidylyltransferase [Lachnospiraceae bacterium]|nr:phosphatidate cytidylyltransferase [Lachnospiraceae bacterium]
MFKSRLISGIILVILALITLIVGGHLLSSVLWLISMIAFRELCTACRIHSEKKKVNSLEITGYLGIICYYLIMTVLESHLYMVLVVLMSFLSFLFIYVFSFPRYHANQVMSAFFSFMYAPVMFSFLFLTRQLEYGVYYVWMIFISSWISDTCAYCVGMLFGRHKLAPILSPKKSIEGSLGGIIGSVIVGALFGHFIVEQVIAEQQVTWIFALIGGVGSIVSQIGDLAASAIKRNHEIKDYGKLIPGHGGIMDRFDSVIVTAPMIYFLFSLLVN